VDLARHRAGLRAVRRYGRWILSWLSGQSIATGVLIGGASFGGTVTLVVLVINLLMR
jgi:hypothetical protein